MNFALELQSAAVRGGWLGRTAVHSEVGSWSYARLFDTAARVTTMLRRHGVLPRDRVLIALPNSIAWVVAFLAVARAGATVVPVDPELSAAQHLDLTADCDPVLVVTAEFLRHHFTGLTCVTDARMLGGAAAADPARAQRTDGPLYVQYTSGRAHGTRGAQHPHGNPGRYLRAAGRALGVSAGDVTLPVSGFHLAHAFTGAFMAPLTVGGAVVLTEYRPDPAEAAALAERFAVTKLYADPSWLDTLPAAPAGFDKLAAVHTCGGQLPRVLAAHAAAALGAPVLHQFASPETGGAALANTARHNNAGTVGRPVPGYRAQIRDAAGRVLPDGAEGELWLAGPGMMSGYLGDPAVTGVTGGWLRTGERARREPRGAYIHIGSA
ncbi:AMP-binding protein [Actinoplanes sp. NPDC051411]|uniref:class I adenylate-forming enzyme family protein n=1 Tax=Actinoplanes sp. NPDC051411 TaxID=3155522 RepID=UPI00343A9687